MRRYLVVLIVGCLFAVALSPAPAWAGKARKPNIIFILADDLGYGDVGCYGQQKVKTPHLDKLAKQGMRFTQAYAGSTVCAPSRSALMEGKHTGHCRVRGNARVPLRPEDVTVAEVLQEAGYVTGLIGKWGLGEPDTTGIPNAQGFDYFYGYLNQHHAHNYYPDYLWRNKEKVLLPNVVLGDSNYATKKEQYAHDLFTKEALHFIEKNKTKPFFLYLAYTLPHANNELGRAKGNGMEVPSDAPYTNEPWPQVHKNHAAMITYLDRDIGQILDLLQRLGLDEDTVVFFTSDNGPHAEGGANPNFFNSSGPLRGFKRSLHEGGIRVPMIVRWTGKIKGGTTNEYVWAFWDFLPTGAELAGTRAPKGIDGISIMPTLVGKDQEKHKFLYWEFHEAGFHQGVRMGDWKAVRHNLGKIELYNLKTDLGEKNNVAEMHPDVVAQIETYLKTARTESQDFPIKVGKKKKAGS
jgi:arylsulfatase A-like enzyme